MTIKYSISLSPPKIDPNQRLQQGLAFHQNGQMAQARKVYEEILKSHPTHADALHLLGVRELHSQAPARAVELISKSIAIFPNNPASHLNLGNALKELQRHDAALASFDNALALKPDYAMACVGKGVVLQAQQHMAAAMDCFDQAIAINPKGFEAFFNRGNLQKDTGQFEAAITSYAEAIARNPNFVEAYLSRSAMHLELGQFDAAFASFDQAIARDPSYPKSYWNKAMALLLAGHYAEGLKLYEWRWKVGFYAGKPARFPSPPWLGAESLMGKTILLHAEQGLGDTIQFCRYAKSVAALGARVILEVQEPLLALLSNLDGPSEVIARGNPLPAFDVHCPLLSLPLAFNTAVSTIPCETAYLRANPKRVDQWSTRLGPKMKPRVGLVWSGNNALVDDHTRSIPLATLLPHLPSGYEYVCLQKDIRDSDAKVLHSGAACVRPFCDALNDFSDTAALCDLMDFVISVDTSVAHLGGALGKETCVLLSHLPDWRWLTHRTDSPWYPTVSLYRQALACQWEPVVERVGMDLLARMPRA